MKISIRNFGPIASFDYDLKQDFVLILGENNIGKSYAISLIYLVLKAFVAGRRTLRYSRRFEFAYSDDDVEFLDTSEPPTGWIAKFEEEAKEGALGDNVDVTEHVRGDIKAIWDRLILPELRESLYGTFNEIANLQNRFTNAPLELEISDDSYCIRIGVDDNRLVVKHVHLRQKYVVRRVRAVRTIKEVDDAVYIYFPDERTTQFERNYGVALYRIFTRPLREAASLISDLHYLPASRSGLYQALSAFSQIVAELAKTRTLLSSRLVLPAIAVPLSDYFLKLSNVRALPRTETQTIFADIAKRIEDDVLRGRVEFDPKTKRLLFEPTGLKLSLDLSATSSMVSEISPIAAYFKYVMPRSDMYLKRGRPGEVRPKQVVIIEEPEAHLHPQLQITIMEVFAEMVRTAGVKVIMTSHSNYVFNKVSNLVIEGAIDRHAFRGVLFRRMPQGGVASDLKVSGLGVEDANFVDVGETLYEERVKLIRKKESEEGVRRGSSA